MGQPFLLDSVSEIWSARLGAGSPVEAGPPVRLLPRGNPAFWEHRQAGCERGRVLARPQGMLKKAKCFVVASQGSPFPGWCSKPPSLRGASLCRASGIWLPDAQRRLEAERDLSCPWSTAWGSTAGAALGEHGGGRATVSSCGRRCCPRGGSGWDSVQGHPASAHVSCCCITAIPASCLTHTSVARWLDLGPAARTGEPQVADWGLVPGTAGRLTSAPRCVPPSAGSPGLARRAGSTRLASF